MSSVSESPSDLWLEHSIFLGFVLGSIAYGCFLILFVITTFYILQSEKRNRRAINIIYISALLVATTLNVSMYIRWSMLTFIDNRNYPGGPVANAFVALTEWNIENSAFVVNNFLTDGLVLYRCLIIWKDNYLVMAFPLLLFVASTVVSIITVYQTSRPAANSQLTIAANFAVPYWSLSIFLNIVVTLLICGRLLFMRKRMREVLGPRHARKYTSVVAMLVESAALYSGTALMYMITFSLNNNVQHLVSPILGSVMPAAPLLILLRVASGNGFSRETTYSMGEVTKPSFVTAPTVSASRANSGLTSTDEMVQTSENESRSLKTGSRGSECC